MEIETLLYKLSNKLTNKSSIPELAIAGEVLKIAKHYIKKRREVSGRQECLQAKPKTVICKHGKSKYFCKECKGSQICKHDKSKYFCKECGGKGICEHGKSRYFCKECGGKGICEHGTSKYTCKYCRKSRA